MAFLLDSGILLRLVDTEDVKHSLVRQAVRVLGDREEELFATTQNIAEYFNVATRPVANNGLGLSPDKAGWLLTTDIEPVCELLIERDVAYHELKRLITTYKVSGKQVHDDRLVAMMLAWQIENILTLNDRDFRRYEPEGINIVTSEELIASA